MNGEKVSNCSNYPHLAYVKSMMTFGFENKTSSLHSEGFYEDEGNFEGDEGALRGNTGWMERQNLFKTTVPAADDPEVETIVWTREAVQFVGRLYTVKRY